MMKKRKKSFSRFGYFLLWSLVAGSLFYWVYRNDPRRFRRFFIDDTKYAVEIRAAAARHGVPPQLVRALIRKESGFDAGARGKAGEIGLMQLLPSGAAAEWARVNKVPRPDERSLFEVPVNLDIGCWYLGRALNRWSCCKDKEILALAEYNAGARNADRWKPADPAGDVLAKIDYPGTADYVMEIMKWYRRYLSETALEKDLQ